MPRTRALIRPDPRAQAIRTEIGGIIMRMGITKKELADKTGINYSTLMSRIGTKGDIGEMRLSEYWKIQDVGNRG